MPGNEIAPPKSDKEQNGTSGKNHWYDPYFWLLVTTAIATSVAAYFTCNQWLTAVDSEKRQLRAYMTLKENLSLAKTEVRFSDPATPMRVISGIWQNSGNTPTTNFIAKAACNPEKPFVFDDPTHVYQKIDRWVFGPHDEFPFFACPIRLQDIVTFEQTHSTVFIYGEAHYGDVFLPKDARHVTRFCVMMQNISGDPGVAVDATTFPCPNQQGKQPTNCTDDECIAP